MAHAASDPWRSMDDPWAAYHKAKPIRPGAWTSHKEQKQPTRSITAAHSCSAALLRSAVEGGATRQVAAAIASALWRLQMARATADEHDYASVRVPAEVAEDVGVSAASLPCKRIAVDIFDTTFHSVGQAAVAVHQLDANLGNAMRNLGRLRNTVEHGLKCEKRTNAKCHKVRFDVEKATRLQENEPVGMGAPIDQLQDAPRMASETRIIQLPILPNDHLGQGFFIGEVCIWAFFSLCPDCFASTFVFLTIQMGLSVSLSTGKRH